MIGRVNTGGGIANAFAAIGVAYPTGSVCTCSNGTKTLTAKDTSGEFFFLIPSAGTWTVTATDGTRTKSQSIVITTQYQCESVALRYWSGELYTPGDEWTDVTGGWSRASSLNFYGYPNSAPINFRDNDISLTGASPASTFSCVCTNNAIDLTNINTLKVNISSYTSYVSDFSAVAGVIPSRSGAIQTIREAEATRSSVGEISISVANITGSKYIAIHSLVRQGTFCFNNAWLEI